MEVKQQDEMLALIARNLAGLADQGEIDQMNEWISMSEANHRYFEQVRNIWNESDMQINPDKISIPDALDKVLSRFSKPEPLKKLWNFWQKIAAVMIIPLISGTLLLTYFKNNRSASPENQVYNEVYAAFGTHSSITLADSTIVWLNSGSRFKYPEKFRSKDREVFLDGEAYFEVKSDLYHPFVVNTNGLQVIATGTKFNIFGYDSQSVAEVTLVSGKVIVNGKEGNGSKLISELKPGQHLEYNLKNSEKNITEEDTYKYIAWKDGKLIFRNDAMIDVLNKIGLIFNVDFEIHGEKLKDFRYRATFEDETLDQILKLLKLSSPLDYTELKRTPLPDGTFPKKKVVIFPLSQP